jgi:hypothetical protein
MTLRVRLTASLVILVAVGLLVSDVATYTALRSYLVHRLDQQLRSSPRPVLFALSQPGLPGAGPGGDGGDQMLPEGTYGVIFSSSGSVVGDPVVFDYGGTSISPPDLPANIHGGSERDPVFFSADAVGSGPGYHAAAYRLTDGAPLVHRLLDTSEHHVERDPEPPDLRARVGLLDAARQIPGRDRLRGLLDLLQRPQAPLHGEQREDRHGREHGQGDRAGDQ